MPLVVVQDAHAPVVETKPAENENDDILARGRILFTGGWIPKG